MPTPFRLVALVSALAAGLLASGPSAVAAGPTTPVDIDAAVNGPPGLGFTPVYADFEAGLYRAVLLPGSGWSYRSGEPGTWVTNWSACLSDCPPGGFVYFGGDQLDLDSAEEAFAATTRNPVWLALEGAATLAFYVQDTVPGDNQGGLSLDLEPVAPSEPALVSIQRLDASDDSPGADEALVTGALALGQPAWTDRDGRYAFVSTDLFGIDFVQMVDADRDDPDYQLELRVRRSAPVYLAIDNRVGDGVALDPPTLGTAMPWVEAEGFAPSSDALGASPGVARTLYRLDAAPPTLVLGAQADGSVGRAMYLVAVPEPSAERLAAAALATLLLGGFRRRC